METSQNPAVQMVAIVADKAKMETQCAKAIKYMEAYDAYFNFNELEIEAKDIFQEFYCNFLAGNIEFLEKVSGGVALAICKADIKRRKDEGWINKYDDPLDFSNATFNYGQLDQVPSFTFIIST